MDINTANRVVLQRGLTGPQLQLVSPQLGWGRRGELHVPLSEHPYAMD